MNKYWSIKKELAFNKQQFYLMQKLHFSLKATYAWVFTLLFKLRTNKMKYSYIFFLENRFGT